MRKKSAQKQKVDSYGWAERVTYLKINALQKFRLFKKVDE